MAKTQRAMVAELARAFERRGLIVERGPFAVTNEAGEVVLIAENRVRLGQMELPLAPPPAAARAGQEGEGT